MKQIVGLSGTFASGKDTLAEYLVKKHNFMHVSTSDLLRESIKARGEKANRDALTKEGIAVRSRYGNDILVKKALQKYRDHEDNYSGIAISAIRHPAEAQAVKDAGGIMLFVDADVKKRYQRGKARGRLDDWDSFEQFCNYEERELNAKSKSAQNIKGVKKLASKVVLNNGTPEELFQIVENLLE